MGENRCTSIRKFGTIFLHSGSGPWNQPFTDSLDRSMTPTSATWNKQNLFTIIIQMNSIVNMFTHLPPVENLYIWCSLKYLKFLGLVARYPTGLLWFSLVHMLRQCTKTDYEHFHHITVHWNGLWPLSLTSLPTCYSHRPYSIKCSGKIIMYDQQLIICNEAVCSNGQEPGQDLNWICHQFKSTPCLLHQPDQWTG